MSPEQARGDGVDRRTDIWAFGCMLYEMLAGRRAFSGERTADVLARVLEREPELDALPATTPPAVRRLLTRCLAKDPNRRLRDIADARADLHDAAKLAAGESAQPGRARHLRRTATGDLWLIDVDSGATRQLTTDGVHHNAAAWSPTDAQFVFTGRPGGVRNLHLMKRGCRFARAVVGIGARPKSDRLVARRPTHSL